MSELNLPDFCKKCGRDYDNPSSCSNCDGYALKEDNANLIAKLYSTIFVKGNEDTKAGIYQDAYRKWKDMEECISIALDALNFACGSDNREIYKCCATAIKSIMNKINSASVKENIL